MGNLEANEPSWAIEGNDRKQIEKKGGGNLRGNQIGKVSQEKRQRLPDAFSHSNHNNVLGFSVLISSFSRIPHSLIIILMDLRRLLAGLGGGNAPQVGSDQQVVDTAEIVHISSLALLKMLKHGIILFSY